MPGNRAQAATRLARRRIHPSRYAAALGGEREVLLALHQRPRAVQRGVDVGEAAVERCEAETDDVRLAEVGPDAGPLDQRRADLPALRVGDRDVAAAAGGVAWRDQREAQRSEPRVVALDGESGQRPRLGRDPLDARL